MPKIKTRTIADVSEISRIPAEHLTDWNSIPDTAENKAAFQSPEFSPTPKAFRAQPSEIILGNEFIEDYFEIEMYNQNVKINWDDVTIYAVVASSSGYAHAVFYFKETNKCANIGLATAMRNPSMQLAGYREIEKAGE